MPVNIGPRIGIEGEAEYRKALQNIIQQQKTLKAEMNETASAFDKNTTAQEKVKAKTEQLNRAIEIQKERVEQTKRMVEESTAKYGEADTRTQKWKEALANANTELHNLETELKNLPSDVELLGKKFEEVGQKITDVSGKIQSVGDGMTKYVTAPIMAVGTAAVASFKSLDSGYDTIIKKTGATGDALGDLKEQANDVFTTMNVSMDDVGAAIGEVNTRFGLSGDAAEEMSRKFLEFAQINGVDVSGSIDKVQTALAAFNMDASEAGDVLDVITVTSQRYGVSADTLSSNLTSNATAFQEMGLSAYQAVDFMGQLEVAGADSSAVIQGMKKALKEATEQGVPFDQALADLQNTIINGTDSMDGLSAAYDLFGKNGAAVFQAVRNGQISFTDFAASTDILNDSLGATSDTYNATLDPIDKFKIALNNAKVTGAEVGASLLEIVTPALEHITGAIQTAAEWWGNLDESTQKHIITAAGIVAAIGPVLSIIGRVGTAVGSVVSFIGTAMPVISTVGTVLTGTIIPAIGGVLAAIAPALPIIAAVAAAVAAVILVVKNWGAISEWFKGVWESVTTAVSNAATAVKDGISNAWTTVKTKTTETWNSLKSATSETWNAIKSKVQENGGGIKGILTTAGQAYMSIWKGAFNTIDSITGGKLSSALSTVSSKMEAIKSAFTDKMNAARTAVSNAIDRIKSIFNFSWKLPDLKLPHFSITGSFSLKPPSVPRLSVSWYKKAYSQPMMFNSPTVLATSSGLKGFGDGRGGEIVIGQNMMYSMIRGAVSDAMGATYNNDINIVVNAAPGQDAEEIAEMVSRRINEAVYDRRAVFA